MKKLAYKIIGQGPDLVLLHGWGMHSGVWAPVLSSLSDSFRVTLIDLPGHGQSRGVVAGSLEVVSEQLLDVAPARAGWIGWSLGGVFAMQLALAHPERVIRLMPVASNPSFMQRENWPCGTEADVLERFSQQLSLDWAGTIRRFIALQFLGTRTAAVTLRTLQREIEDRPPDLEALAQGLDWLRSVDLKDELMAFTMPVHFLLGGLDRLVPVCLSDSLGRLGLSAQVIEGVGHAPFISRPDDFCAAVNLFFKDTQ